MNEKISNMQNREDKVKRVKTKILSEIEKEFNKTKEEMKWCLEDNDDDFDFLVKRVFALLNLKEYIEDDCSFMAYTYKNPAMDIIIYYVSDEQLSIWLQDNYSFVFKNGEYVSGTDEYGYPTHTKNVKEAFKFYDFDVVMSYFNLDYSIIKE